MRNHKLMRGVATLGLLAGSFVAGASAVAGSAGATVVHPHTTPVYDLALVNSKQREIWPYTDPGFFTVTNVSDTVQPMYRPLVWVGLGSSTAWQPALSIIAAAPAITGSGKIIDFNVKTWKWSNGQVITARDVLFWLNLAKDEPTNYGGYAPTVGVPDQIQSVTAVGQHIHMVLKTSTNPFWWLYNGLATVTPMPIAWDAQALGLDTLTGHPTLSGAAANCGTLTFSTLVAGADNACTRVYNYFTGIQLGTAYRTHNMDAIFQVTDGPYHITNYHYASDSSYNVELSPRPGTVYSGPQKAHAKVEFHWYATLASEILALQAGNQLSRGGVTPDMVTAKPNNAAVGTNLDPAIAAHYNPVSGNFWGFDYAYFNFNGHAAHQALLNQLYIRIALEQSVNQVGIISAIYNGYAKPGCSPLPAMPGPGVTALTCPYPYNPVAAKAQLTSHGWDTTVFPAVCVSPGTGAGHCGAGIPLNTTLSLNFEYNSGGVTAPLDEQIAIEQTEWHAKGFDVTLSANTDGSIIGDCLSDDPSATFDLCQYGGWVYSPGGYPSGEQLFLTGAGSNTGFYHSTQMDNLIKATDHTTVSLHAYALYAAQQLPVLFGPASLGVGELKKSVVGAKPPSPLSDFNPEYITAT